MTSTHCQTQNGKIYINSATPDCLDSDWKR